MDDIRMLAVNWKRLARRTEIAINQRDFRNFKFAMREANVIYKKLRPVLSDLELSDETSDIKTTLMEGVRYWTGLIGTIGEWKNEVKLGLDRSRVRKKNDKIINKGYLFQLNKKGRNVRLKAH